MTAPSGPFGPGFRLMLLSVASLAIGGVIGVIARGLGLSDQLIGYAAAGLFLLAPLPLLAGDATEALLVRAVQTRRLSSETYQRSVGWLVPAVLVAVGMATYPVVLFIGGPDLLGATVIIGAFVLFGALPVLGWLLGKLRRPRPES
ncbi:MAG TPA: hypothetical protein VET90_02220 [Candidatus Binatus sp.]|nr:hypothetical protein [Candidatus Binatus sp.]